MSRIRNKNTKPEIAVRSLLHGMGFRFTVNGPKNRSLPGKPDIVLPKHRAAVFVHGCYWHRHANCKHATTPKTRTEWWKAKFDGNVERDGRNQAQLRDEGWQIFVVWECETKTPEGIEEVRQRLMESLD